MRYKSRAKPTEAEKLAIIEYYLAPHNLRPTADKFNRGMPIIKRILNEFGITEHSEQTKRTCELQQAKLTCLEKYGVEYSFQSENNKQKSKATLLANLGVENPMQAAAVQEKIKQTNLQKYGVANPMSLTTIKHKSFSVRKQKGTCNTSAAEERVFEYLTNKYKTVIRQYSDTRYPFRCDFYIKDLDTFVELNLHWTHGYKEYTGSKEDLIKIAAWKAKAETSNYYKSAIEVWTSRDPKKFNIARANNLRYIAVYKENELYNLI